MNEEELLLIIGGIAVIGMIIYIYYQKNLGSQTNPYPYVNGWQGAGYYGIPTPIYNPTNPYSNIVYISTQAIYNSTPLPS